MIVLFLDLPNSGFTESKPSAHKQNKNAVFCNCQQYRACFSNLYSIDLIVYGIIVVGKKCNWNLKSSSVKVVSSRSITGLLLLFVLRNIKVLHTQL